MFNPINPHYTPPINAADRFRPPVKWSEKLSPVVQRLVEQCKKKACETVKAEEMTK